MVFGLGKLAVLESKLDIYEDLSKEMLDKLERAVSTISDNSNRIAVVLERHESRLDEGERVNDAITQMIKDHQKYDDRMFKNVNDKIEELDKKVEENSRFIFSATAVLATIVTLLQVAPHFTKYLTHKEDTANMVIAERVVNELS